jgi:tripartite-type tricarboxylate transporter receptor subunit TctC
MKSFRFPVLQFAVLLAAASCVFAQQRADPAADYPAKPVRIVVGFTPGGGPDITARYVAQKLTESLKQQVIVDNRPGAGGTIAANLVAPAIYPKLPYDTLKDFAGITETASSSYVLVTSPSAGMRSMADLLAAAKAKPGQLNFASAGVGSGTHFAAEIFKAMAEIDVVHVPFKGIPEPLAETMTGRVQFFMAPIANAVNLVREGKLAALAVSSSKRQALLPDVPTIAEAGVPGYESILWFGLLTSSGVPQAIVAKLNREIVHILSEPELKERWNRIGMEPRPMTSEAFDKVVRDDIAIFTRIARDANIRAN